jgi:hypothetical protein
MKVLLLVLNLIFNLNSMALAEDRTIIDSHKIFLQLLDPFRGAFSEEIELSIRGLEMSIQFKSIGYFQRLFDEHKTYSAKIGAGNVDRIDILSVPNSIVTNIRFLSTTYNKVFKYIDHFCKNGMDVSATTGSDGDGDRKCIAKGTNGSVSFYLFTDSPEFKKLVSEINRIKQVYPSFQINLEIDSDAKRYGYNVLATKPVPEIHRILVEYYKNTVSPRLKAANDNKERENEASRIIGQQHQLCVNRRLACRQSCSNNNRSYADVFKCQDSCPSCNIN